MVLPAGTSVPPLPHLVVLLVGGGGVGWLLARERPEITERLVVAFAPWMVVGAGLHALYQLDAVPESVAPFLGTPAVYLSTFVLLGGAWLLARVRWPGESETPLAVLGSVLAGGSVLALVLAGGSIALRWPATMLAIAVALAGLSWEAVRRLAPGTVDPAPRLGALVVFAHVLDGVSTAIGYDFLGFSERTPLSGAILGLADSLPTAPAIGAGWLFVLVKLALALAVVYLFADYVRDRPDEGYLLMGFVAAVGLGPGTQNVLLALVG